MQIPDHMEPEPESVDPILCHCLQVTESAVANAIATWNLRSVKEVCRYTEAGGGCTACHARIRRHLCETSKRASVNS